MIILDSCGIGELPDASKYGDTGSNTLVNTAKAVGGLKLPNLEKLGLGKIDNILGVADNRKAIGNYGKMTELSVGKDSTAGHWEMMGLVLKKPFPVYPNGFPESLIKIFEEKIGTKTLGNIAASGTEILEKLGEKHMQTGFPIVYTSADSVFQVAAHEEIIPVGNLYEICQIARRILTGEHGVGRVIARPFMGKPGNFRRTANRKDFSLEPVGETILDQLKEKNFKVMGIGKIKDLFAGRGVTAAYHTESNQDGVEKTLQALKTAEAGLFFTTLVDFDTLWGHRNDPLGFASGLQQFDVWLPEISSTLKEDDLLIITADHGCDPTTSSTDHSREYVPLLVYGKKIKSNINLGIRKTFADIGATIADIFGLKGTGVGVSFLKEIL